MLYLKQSTASQSVLIGPFVDDTDGTTAETALSIANTDIRLSKNGGNLAAKNSVGATHDEAGWYTITLDATDTNTVGRLQGHVKVTGALMVHFQATVVEEAVYDMLFASGAVALATAASLATAQTDLDTLTGSDGVTLATSQPNYAPATASALSTAQTDLDTLTGSDGVTLAASQPNYAPATAAALATTDGVADAIKAVTDNLPNSGALTDLATAAAVSTAQADLDTLTGTDGVTLAASQPNYAPATASALATTDGVADDIKAVVDAILADTGTDGVVLSATERNAVADAFLDRDMSTGTDSGSATTRTVRQALRFLRNKWSISGTTLTVTEEDDTTASWTSEVSTDASADPITGNDPASS